MIGSSLRKILRFLRTIRGVFYRDWTDPAIQHADFRLKKLFGIENGNNIYLQGHQFKRSDSKLDRINGGFCPFKRNLYAHSAFS